jgi:hypothetical protein
MVGVAALAGGENRPHGVELTVFAKQMAIAENVRLEVPDAHEVNVTGGGLNPTSWGCGGEDFAELEAFFGE